MSKFYSKPFFDGSDDNVFIIGYDILSHDVQDCS